MVTLVPRIASADSRVDHRAIPRGFEREAQFFERLKGPHRPGARFTPSDAPAWDLAIVRRYVAPEGIEFIDVNHRLEGRVTRADILRSLRERRGPPFTAFAHLSHISSIPSPQYSTLRFARRADGQTTVQVADWYTLTFRRAGAQPLIVRWEYRQLEGD
jgi:hypothetical protein